MKKLYEFEFNGQVIDTLVCTRLIWPKEKLFELDSDLYEDKTPSNLKGGASLKAWGYRLSDHKIEVFENEVSNLLKKKSIQEVLTVKEGQHPYLLKQFMGKKISIETMVMLCEITQCQKKWDNLISDNLIYPEVINKINKYKSFINYDYNKFKKKLIQLCST